MVASTAVEKEGHAVASGPARRGLAAVSRSQWTRFRLSLATLTLDFLAFLASSAVAAELRFGTLRSERTDDLLLLCGPPLFLALFALRGYRLQTLRRRSRSVGVVLLAVGLAAGAALTAAFGLKLAQQLSRLETGYMVVALAVLLAAGRLLVAGVANRLQAALAPRAILLTDRPAGGRAPRGQAIDVLARGWRPRRDDPAFLSALFHAIGDADRVLLDFQDAEERLRWVEVMRLVGVHAEAVEPALGDMAPLGVGSWNGQTTLLVARGPLQLHERLLKRAFDLVVAGALLVLLWPLMLVVAVAIKLNSRGPVLFAQARVGRNNVAYRCFKFRTMRVEASDPRGFRSTSRRDPRVTGVGRVLRAFSLDELPQLMNVLRGEMSLVGPRPHAFGSTAEGQLFWEVMPGYWSRHAIKPGMTGLAQVRGLRGATVARADLAKRVEADLEYINGWSLWLDIRILARTLFVVAHRNAY